jgi:hypothetical protein
VLKGGTGLTTYLQGDLLYAGAGGSLTQLGIGGISSVLSSNGSVPSWTTNLNLAGGVTAGNALFNSDVNSTNTTSGSLQVLGGAGIVMFGMVAATGIRILSNVDYNANRNNLMIVAVGIGVGMLTLIAPNIFEKLPKELKPILDSGILLTTIAAVILHAFFNGSGSAESGEKGASSAAMSSGGMH